MKRIVEDGQARWQWASIDLDERQSLRANHTGSNWDSVDLGSSLLSRYVELMHRSTD